MKHGDAASLLTDNSKLYGSVMPFNVKLLVAGDPPPVAADKGDVVEVVPSTFDWGSKTVTPAWLRLTVTGVTGTPDTQIGAENKVRAWLQAWQKGFDYSEATGATGGQQRYRIEAIPEVANDLSQAVKVRLRDAIVSRMDGTVANQGTAFVEIDAAPSWPLDEIAFVVNQLAYRRFQFPAALVDSALATVNPGEPVEFVRAQAQANNLVLDKLKT